MRRGFSDSRVIIVLTICLLVETGLLLHHMGILSSGAATRSAGGLPAGYVVKERNQLRRRGMNSLLWEKSAVDEPLYFYDSVLTLGQSTATLRLQGRTDVTLRENTLLTIEPPDDREHGEIRLKIFKGDFHARNPGRAASVEGETWTVALRQGSEVDVRQVKPDAFELQVAAGAAVFRSPHGEEAIGAREMLRITSGEPERIAVDDAMAWTSDQARRVYTHADSVDVHLAWRGEAERLIIQSLGRAEESIPLSATEIKDHVRNLQLPLGQHRLFLRAGGRSSPPLDLEAWRAPVIQLLSPLPRDRIKSGTEVRFLWQENADANQYALDLEGGEGRLGGGEARRTGFSPASSRALVLPAAGDMTWAVVGRDADGFVIPPLYRLPLYVRDNPLAAPKLKTPAWLRRPAAQPQEEKKPAPTDGRGHERGRGASFWRRIERWILPEAAAEELYEMVLEWEPVGGADRYVIEISPTRDFRAPVISRTVTETRFVWRGFPLREYYWRVASGAAHGRLGLFSEPARLEPVVDDVVIKRMPAPEPEGAADAAAVAKAVPPPRPRSTPAAPAQEGGSSPPPSADAKPAAAPARPLPPAEPPDPGSNWIAWRPNYVSARFKGDQGASARVNGESLFGLSAEMPVALPGGESRLELDFSYQQTRFQPEPRERYPFQDALIWRDARLAALRYASASDWGYGAVIRQTFGVRRASDESLRADPLMALGPEIGLISEQGNWRYTGTAGLLLTARRQTLELSQRLRWRVWRGVGLGGGIEGQFISGGSSVGAAFLTVGFEF